MSGAGADAGPGGEVHRGLAGVVVDTTAVSDVDPATSSLTYRGYPVADLAARCSVEQVAHLLWHGDLPTPVQLGDLQAAERSRRALDPGLARMVADHPAGHPMDVLRTAVSWMGAQDPREADLSREHVLDAALGLFARLPTVLAADLRRRRGQAPIAPDPGLGYAENLLAMCFGAVPEPEVVAAFGVSLVLYAEHSFNASTFTARVVASTLSDPYSAVTAAVGALRGPLHGGANEAVMHMLDEVGEPERAAAWLDEQLGAGRKVMGFGHRVYKDGDSRVPTMKAALDDLAARTPDGPRLVAVYEELERLMAARKGLRPNLDLPSGPAYHLMGFDTEVFTPLFVLSRVVGWTAHVLEQLEHNALIRPLSRYTGPPPRLLPPS